MSEPSATTTTTSTRAGFRPIARSPIRCRVPEIVDGWEVETCRATADLTLTDLGPVTKIVVKAPPGGATERTLGVPFGRSVRVAAAGGPPARMVIGSGPGEWLLLAAPNTAAKLLAWCEEQADGTTEPVSFVDLTHGRALLRLAGPRCVEVLAKVCPIDLADEITPDGAAFSSSVAGLATDVVRDDAAGVPRYLLHCERSSGAYLFDALLSAGAEFGIEVDGFPR